MHDQRDRKDDGHEHDNDTIVALLRIIHMSRCPV
jgi:hypothetical protein